MADQRTEQAVEGGLQPRDLDSATRERLALHVYGEHATAEQKAEPVADLLWRIGEYRRELEDAHSKLDSRGAPRHSESGGVLRLFGRLQWLIDNGQLR